MASSAFPSCLYLFSLGFALTSLAGLVTDDRDSALMSIVRESPTYSYAAQEVETWIVSTTALLNRTGTTECGLSQRKNGYSGDRARLSEMTTMPPGWTSPYFYKVVREWCVRQRFDMHPEAKTMAMVLRGVFRGTDVSPTHGTLGTLDGHDELLHLTGFGNPDYQGHSEARQNNPWWQAILARAKDPAVRREAARRDARREGRRDLHRKHNVRLPRPQTPPEESDVDENDGAVSYQSEHDSLSSEPEVTIVERPPREVIDVDALYGSSSSESEDPVVKPGTSAQDRSSVDFDSRTNA